MLIRKDVDNTVRWREGERLHHYFELRCDEVPAEQPAVVTDDVTVTFRELDERANRLARHLIAQGVRPGARIGVLFDKSANCYIALLAVHKAGAAYVPLDGGFPNDRIGFILEDAGASLLLSVSAYQQKLDELGIAKIYVDADAETIAAQGAARVDAGNGSADDLAYIIYTSGTTGKPKGVAVNHSSICNFVKVAAEIYGYRPGDRVYQGMTIAFDFSVEELWVPLLAGAALVPARSGVNLVGDELADFLLERRITGFCCVPTLLATIEKDLPDLRVLIVSGEACPQNLVTRWHKPGRSILNAYGPTEATVTATLTELYPNKPVTIGGPLPTYTIVILDPDKDVELADGESGEVGIAGIGLAEGYLNRPELTEQKFIKDFLNIPNNPSGRIYRTGDLGRINADDEIEYQGRIDTQVKIRGYRIELTEIESLLMQFPEIAQAVVDKYEPEPGAVELVAYYSLTQGAADLPHEKVYETLKSNLPPYMVPAYLERLDVIPMTTSHKADRKNLPKPKGPRFSPASGAKVAPRTPMEELLATVLAATLKVDAVSVEDNFFKDMGAHSLLMARFCSDIRKNPAVAAISMRDVYSYPTIASLAGFLSTQSGGQAPEEKRIIHIPGAFQYYTCGVFQIVTTIAYGTALLWLMIEGFKWAYEAAADVQQLYLRFLILGIAVYVGSSALPIIAKWLLVGRWKATSFPVWSLRYFRFWFVRTLVETAPMGLFAGSPLFNLYLRLLGARVGHGAVIKANAIPAATDLFSIGDNSFISPDAAIPGYKAVGNIIHIGPISIGSDAFVGEASVVDIDTAMGDGAQLGHASSLQSGQRIPAGRRYHGSPAIETAADYCQVEPMRCSSLRRFVYTAIQFIAAFGVALPLGLVGAVLAYPYVNAYLGGADIEFTAPDPDLLTLAVTMTGISVALFAVSVILGLLAVIILPRVLGLFLEKDRDYVMFGFHYQIFRIIQAISNVRFYNVLFGDSSAIVHYLSWIGWNLNKIEQTGSNFGTNQKHDYPFLCEIGSGTMVSDGLAMINTHMSANAFRLCHTRIGDRCYLGNNIHYPPDGKTGDNVLLGTKVSIPIDGPLRENVGLLGSPAFEIPRMVDRDRDFNAQMSETTRQQRLHDKNLHNFNTIVLYLLAGLVVSFVSLYLGYVAILAYPVYGVAAFAALGIVLTIVTVLFFAFCERATLLFGRLQPKTVSIYDKAFWQHERHWKFCETPIQRMFRGTPLKNVVSRLMGVRVGRRVFDDGAQFTERTLVEIGDYCTLNPGVTIQAHSLEEGVFKSEHIRIGNGSTLGPNAFIHYGVTMDDNVLIETDSFLMKGEAPAAHSTWQGNPARAVRKSQSATGSPSKSRPATQVEQHELAATA